MFTEQEQIVRILQGPQFDRERHGSLYDRGRADSYYGRTAEPHWWPNGTHNGYKVTALTSEECAEYLEGFNDNEKSGDFKNWY